jgi:hypothetical protein
VAGRTARTHRDRIGPAFPAHHFAHAGTFLR